MARASLRWGTMYRIVSLARRTTVLPALVLFAATAPSAVYGGDTPNISGNIEEFRKDQPVNQVFFTRVHIANHEDRPVKVDVRIMPRGSVYLARREDSDHPGTTVVLPPHGTEFLLWQTIRVSPAAGKVDVDLKPRFYDSIKATDWVEKLRLWRDADGGLWRQFKNHHPTRSMWFRVFDEKQRVNIWAKTPAAPGEVGRVLVGRDNDNRASLERLSWWAEWADQKP